MNIPNALTVLRLLLTPCFALLLGQGRRREALAVLALAALSDALDGYLARKNNQITTFGKFMDPLADKLLVCSAMICLVDLHRIPSWIVIVIVAREFIISGFRLIAAEKGVVIAASYWGKFKTVSQMFMVILLVFDLGGIFDTLGTVLMWAALLLTVISLADYIRKNVQVLYDVH